VSKRVVINRKSENVYGCADESGLSDAQSCSACSEGRNGDNDSCLSEDEGSEQSSSVYEWCNGCSTADDDEIISCRGVESDDDVDYVRPSRDMQDDMRHCLKLDYYFGVKQSVVS
jgi:hypothetical protein